MPIWLKDPDETVDYELNWAPELRDADTIASSTWIIPTGIAKDSDTHGDSTVTIWLSDGTMGTAYDLINRITTAGGRTEDQSVTVVMREN